MRTIYLRNLPTENVWLFNPNYWKITQISKDECVVVQVTKDTIEISEEDDFFDQINFIRTKLCDGVCQGGSEEITREQFDEFYIQTITKINKLTAA